MQILSVALKNFKTHRDREFQFYPGTNAICGENGAGKTSILEAIAWTLFNYQGDYTKEDLVRNGSSSAQSTVRFISSRDSRTYEVQRCTSRGYTLFDPQLGERLPYTRIKDEVMPWLRQHLGVAPGTDLGQLFARTVGVPQGTFAADFLLTTEARKAVFDSILKVEEYKAAFKQSNSLKRYAEAKVEECERDIARYDEALQALEGLQGRRQAVASDLAQSRTRLTDLQAELGQLQQQRDRILQQATQIQALQNQIQSLATQIQAQQQTQQLLHQSLMAAQQAQAICEAQQASYAAYTAAIEVLQALETQVSARQQVLVDYQVGQKSLEKRQTELTRLNLKLEAFAKAEADIQVLQPAIAHQANLEAQRQTLAQSLQALQSARLERQSIQKQLTRLERDLKTITTEIERITALQAQVVQISTQEQQRDRLQAYLSRIAAAQQFQTELHQLVQQGADTGTHYRQQAETALQTLADLQASLPLLSIEAVEQLRTALESGVELNQGLLAGLRSILEDLAAQVSEADIQRQLHDIQTALTQAYAHRAEVATLGSKQAQQAEFRQQQQQYQQTLAALDQHLITEPEIKAQNQALEKALAELGDPQGQAQLLTKSLRDRTKTETSHRQAQGAQAEIQAQLMALEQQLAAFADLDAAIAEQRQIQQTHQAGYQLYLQHLQTAQRQPQILADLESAIAQSTTLTQRQTELQQTLTIATADYDPQQATQIETTFQNTRTQLDQLIGRLPQQEVLLAELDHQLQSLQATAQQRDLAQQDLTQRKRLQRFINFARRAYKEAGPRITERYIHAISREADRLLRELLNRENVALEWTRDYEIVVQEGSHSRRFINLSGGEQMCAALAVRLALLKVLADIDIAFFDEPTTNMDRPRRERLADAIARIKSFKQLFVISHDDTFEKVTESVILVERDA